MRVSILREAGHEEAMLGLSLNKHGDIELMPDVAMRLAAMDGGHNQFLRHICVWMDITASRGWWQEASKYHWLEMQSESTTHGKFDKPFTRDMFDDPHFIPDAVFGALEKARQSIADRRRRILAVLPDSYLQRRICCTNYQQLRTIYWQRRDHYREGWKHFCDALYGLKNFAYITARREP